MPNDWADERAREIAEQICHDQAYIRGHLDVADMIPYIAAALRAERAATEQREAEGLEHCELHDLYYEYGGKRNQECPVCSLLDERERGQELAEAAQAYRSAYYGSYSDEVTDWLNEALAALAGGGEVKHQAHNNDYTRVRSDVDWSGNDEPVDIVSAGADLEARRQGLQASIDRPLEDREAKSLIAFWQARALKAEAALQERLSKADRDGIKRWTESHAQPELNTARDFCQRLLLDLERAEAAVLKYPEWDECYDCEGDAHPFCSLCDRTRAEGHAPDCLRAELEARK